MKGERTQMINLGNSGDFISIIVGDPHVTGQNPVSRKDFYPETILHKFKEILQLSEDINADAIFSLGDLFHTPDPSNTTKGELGAILQQRKVPFYTLAGNHDLFGGNFSTYKRTGIGLLEKMGALDIILDHKPLFFKKGRLRIQVTGQNYHFNIDHREPELDYCRNKAEGVSHSIHLAHGYLTDKKLLFPHTMISRVQELTEADATFSGHLHNPFRVDYQGKVFANPGALGRITASMGEMRQPKVFILRISESGELTVEDYFLKTAVKPDDVLSRDHLKSDESHYYKMGAFIEGLTQLNQNTNQTLDIYEILHQVSESEGIEQEVKEDALHAISEAETELQGGSEE